MNLTCNPLPPPVIHRICAWCGRDLGDVPCPPDHPEQAGITSHGICAACQKTWLSTLLTPNERPQ
jgi:hypothetical protein